MRSLEDKLLVQAMINLCKLPIQISNKSSYQYVQEPITSNQQQIISLLQFLRT
jgi:hypothetical protein